MNDTKERKASSGGRYVSAFLLRVFIFLKRITGKLPFWRHPNYVPFLLLSHPRCGSTWLHTALNSHPRILSVGEELRKYFHQAWGEEELMRFFNMPHSKLVQALGCKMFYEDAYGSEGMLFWKHWREKQRKVVHLQRRNLLRMVVSEEIALQSKEWSVTHGKKAAGRVKAVEIYPEILMQRMAHVENLQEVFRKQLKDYPAVLTVWYEDLLQNPEEEFNKIQEFLGVAPKSLFSLLERQNPEPVRELLQNYEEVAVLLRGSKWDEFLER